MNEKEQLFQILNTLMKGKYTPEMIYAFINLMDIPPEKMNQELSKFQEEIKQYGSGVLLWLKDSYPIIINMYALIGFKLNNLNVLPNMRLVVDDYYRFVNEVRKKPKLFKEEMKNSQEQLFKGEVPPKDLSSDDLLINNLNKRYVNNCRTLAYQTESYYKMILPEILGLKSSNLINLLLKLPRYLIKIKSIKKKAFPTNNEIVKDIKSIGDDFKRLLEDNKAIAKFCLNLIFGIDSFNVEFTKFLARLHNISIKGPVKHEPYLLVKGYDPDIRDILKNFLESELSIDYPHLSRYVYSNFKYNKYRIVLAHRNPKIRFENGIVYIFRTGKSELEITLNEILKEVKSYGYFIDALCLFERNDLESYLFQRKYPLPQTNST